MLSWAQQHFSTICYLNSNGYKSDTYRSVDQIIALGEAHACQDDGRDAFGALRRFYDQHNDWLFGFFTYDLKNQVEHLSSANHDGIQMPGMHFFVPQVVIIPGDHSLRICCLPNSQPHGDPEAIFHALMACQPDEPKIHPTIKPKPKVSLQRYLQQVNAIKTHICKGDIYEMNYCIEFFDDRADVDPLRVYENLNKHSPTPFSCLYSWDAYALMCASPERFIGKRQNRIVSQPIKGTIARGVTPEEDEKMKQVLLTDPKERSENVMIVDLVRNDLSRTAKDGSVRVEELFGIQSFRHVHQMVSTVVSELDETVHPIEAIRQAFPMGSMTGAPKVRAMQLIEQYEDTKRGLYSGAVGYISPERDFDFNVVIRSILYNRQNKYLSYMAGSAITAGSIPEKEYQECLLKAKGMKNAITG